MSEQTKMDPELKRKWVEALRSGEYHQTRGRLMDGDGFCCLGVLAKICKLEIDAEGDHVYLEGVRAGYAPIKKLVGDYSGLTARNDGEHGYKPHSFSEIADYIEANL